MIFFREYKKRSMYPINPYIHGGSGSLQYEAFIAPSDFNPDAQELNIISVFAAFPDVNKKYIMLISSAVSSTSVSYIGGRTYYYSENGGAYTGVVNGTITWTSGSTKRNIIVSDGNSSVSASTNNGAVWLYFNKNCTTFYCYSASLLKYVHFEKGYYMTSIPDNAFGGCQSITTTINIPSTVNYIGVEAFANCNYVSNITLPSSVTYLGDRAFKECYNAVFNNNNGVTLNLTYLGGSAFQRCYKLNSINLSGGSFTTIYEYAFYNCELITQLSLPSSLTTIRLGSFNGCKYISTINIPSSVNYIDSEAFANCNYVSNITLPPSVTYLGDGAFKQCNNAVFNNNNGVTLNLTYLGRSAFQRCYKLNSINLSGGSFTTIYEYAFYDNQSLLSVSLPSTLTTIYYQSFTNCMPIYRIYAIAAPTADSTSFPNKSALLHVPIGATGYTVAPWTNTSIFSTIIYDL